MTDQTYPLCVDLDDTLIHSDLLVESALALFGRNPLYAFAMALWLIHEKAHLKREIANRCDVSAATLPYNMDLIEWLRGERDRRPLVLCTASDARHASAVADHLDLFSEVLASDGCTNLSGHRKDDALLRRFGNRGFDYAENSSVDVDVWRHARNAIVVSATPATQKAAARVATVERVFDRQRPKNKNESIIGMDVSDVIQANDDIIEQLHL